MIYNWFKIFNLVEFEDSLLTSKQYDVILEGYDSNTILVTKGIGTSVNIDDVFLPINLNEKNPFAFEDRAVYLDDNNDVWVGIAVDED